MLRPPYETCSPWEFRTDLYLRNCNLPGSDDNTQHLVLAGRVYVKSGYALM